MAAGKYGEVDAETRKALGQGENDDVEAIARTILCLKRRSLARRRLQGCPDAL